MRRYLQGTKSENGNCVIHTYQDRPWQSPKFTIIIGKTQRLSIDELSDILMLITEVMEEALGGKI